MIGENPAKNMPFVYSIIWFMRNVGLKENIIEIPKFMDIFKK